MKKMKNMKMKKMHYMLFRHKLSGVCNENKENVKWIGFLG